MDLNGKVAVVTGGGGGIGLSIAKSLLENGVSVVLFDVNIEKGEASKRQFEEQYGSGKVDFVCGDVMKHEDLEGAVRSSVDKFSSLDIWVNNAGISNYRTWEDIIDTNLKGVVRGSQVALKRMSRKNGGRGGVIVNISSLAGIQPSPLWPEYSASKHGVIGYTTSLGNHEEYERTGVRYVAVCPGFTETDLVTKGQVSVLQRHRDVSDADFFVQKPDVVGASVVEMVRSAPNGSIWVVEDGEPGYQISWPSHKSLRVTNE